jgi:hypothetical protein
MQTPFVSMSGMALSVALVIGLGAGFAAAAIGSPEATLSLEDELIEGLALSPEQDALWQGIAAARAENLRLTRARADEVRAALEDELANAAPDLGRVAEIAEPAVDEVVAQLRANRDRRLALYATLDAEQKGQVRQALLRAMRRWDRVRSGLLLFFGTPSV